MNNYIPPVSINELKKMQTISFYSDDKLQKAYKQVIYERNDLQNRILSNPYVKSIRTTLESKISLLELELKSIDTEIKLLEEKFIDKEIYKWCKKIINEVGEEKYYEYCDFKGVFFINIFIKDLKKIKEYKKELNKLEIKLDFKLERKPSYVIRNNENLELLIENLISKKQQNKSYIIEVNKDFDIIDNIEKYKNKLKLYNNSLYFIERLLNKINDNNN